LSAPPPPNKRRRRLEALARALLGLGLFAVVLYWLAPDWGALAERVELHLGWALVGLAGTSVASIVTAARWRLLAEAMGGTRLPYAAYFYGLVVTRFIGQFTSTLAMDLVGRGVALRSAGSDQGLGHAATQVVLERLLDLVLPLFLIAWALALREGWFIAFGSAEAGLSLALFVAVFLLVAIPALAPGVRLALRIYLGLKAWWAERRDRHRDEPSTPAAPPPLPEVGPKLATAVAVFSVLRFAAVVVQFWGIARAVGLDLSWSQMTAATPIAQLAGMLGFTPGGLGILEVGWAGGLGWVGVDTTAISLFVLAQRLGVIVFFGMLSALSWPFSPRPDKPPPGAENPPSTERAESPQ